MKKAYLVLSDGSVYEGKAFGADAGQIGELVFTTGVVGYIETLTDPCYAGQIVMQTFPLIGNYGIIEEDFAGKCALRGYVVREWCDAPSNFRCEYDIDAYLKKNGIPGICGVDTRAITRKLRDHGPMNAMICSEVPADLEAIKAYAVSGSVEEVSGSEIKIYPAENKKHSVAVMDFGMRNYICAELQKRGCEATVFPANAAAEDILGGGFDGVVLSGGPGNPADNGAYIAEIQKLMGKLPLFGIGLGHQMAAIAAGGSVEKMPYGHRGGSQPVKELATGKTYITSQNHGYCVVSGSVKTAGQIFENANDHSCEGLYYPDMKALTVQFEPECQPGPRDTSFPFDRFISMMGGEC